MSEDPGHAERNNEDTQQEVIPVGSNLAEEYDISLLQRANYLRRYSLLGVQVRNENTAPEIHRANPPYHVDSDVAINSEENTDHGNDSLLGAVGWSTGTNASRNHQGNHARRQLAGPGLFIQGAGTDSPWIQPDEFNSLGIGRRYVNPADEEQSDHPVHIAETYVTIHPIIDNQASAVGEVTEFSTSNDPHINDAVRQHIVPAVADQDAACDIPLLELPIYRQRCINPRHRDYKGNASCYSDSALNVSWQHNTDNQPSTVRRLTAFGASNEQQIPDDIQQHAGLAGTGQDAPYRKFVRWQRCVNPRHRDYEYSRSCYSDTDLNVSWELDTDNQPSTVRRVIEFNPQQNTRDDEACNAHSTSEPYGLVYEVVLITNDRGTGLRRLVTLQVHDSVHMLKQAMEQTVNIPAERQVWLFKDVELRDTDSLAMIEIRPREAIEVMDRQMLQLIRE